VTCVVARWILVVSEDVDERLGHTHARASFRPFESERNRSGP
jgi:hypothetical protein